MPASFDRCVVGNDDMCLGLPITDAVAQRGFMMPNPASTGLPNPASYTNNGDGSVTDNVTGLVWEDTVDNGTYAPQAQVATYCASKGAGWRLPTRLELVSLVDFTIAMPGPTIDDASFPNTPSDAFWTSSAFIGYAGSGWDVSFFLGSAAYSDVTNGHRARCVRDPAPKCYPTRYLVEAAGLVLDRTTGLTWQQVIDQGSYTWSAAMDYCASLGAGWRVPSPAELQTIVDDTKVRPSIDGTIFPNTPAMLFWASSASPGAAGSAWGVDFIFGLTSGGPVTGAGRVRCAR
jgi:hypothetical protein